MRGTLFFLRKPLKPVIYSVVFCVLSLVAFVFALQYELDKIAIRENVNNYSYVGTVTDTAQIEPDITGLSPDIVRRFAESEYVKEVENRRIVSGYSEDTNAMLEYFITDDTIDMYGMVEGYIWPNYDYDPVTGCETALLTVQKTWAGVLSGQYDIYLTVYRDEDRVLTKEESVFYGGERILFTGRFLFDRVHNGMMFTAMEACNPAIKSERNVLDENPVIIIPTEYGREETDAYVEAELTKRGMFEYVDRINKCAHIFTVRPVWDMSMMVPFATHATYIYDGRAINPADAGTKVCVINQVIANKNYLKVGDKIKLALSDRKYICNTVTHDGEWESGFPTIGQELPDYGATEEYEIVGIFNFYFRRDCEEDLYSFSRNDIFIPAQSVGITDYTDVKPINFSFRVLGPEYEDFMDELDMDIAEAGYAIRLLDSGWEDFRANYESITTRKIISLISACMFFIAATILFIVLLLKHFKYEYGLRRLNGSSSLEASTTYLSGYVVLALPALIVALLGTGLVYSRWLIFKMAEVIEEGLPGTFECFEIMGKWAGLSFMGGLLLLFIIAMINGRKNLLGMIK